ncbi:methyltransferase domain-containing protein [Candidatus Parcubacteria bacterium]|nr:methyltransferase domain-containing protein [Candidatus Parcubacteria bacterium]
MKERDQFTIRQPEYLESFEAFRDSKSLQQIITKVQEQITQKGENLHCLDSMAGTGIIGHKIKEVFDKIKIVYQDKSPKMLESGAYQDNERILSDATEIGLPDDSFDIVFCRGGLNNVSKDDYPLILCEYTRIINANGITILQDYFARTVEEKDILNRIETEVANLEGKNDVTYVPTLQELKSLIQNSGAKVSDKQSFNMHISMKDRFATKGIDQPDLSKIKTILENQTYIQYEETKNDIIVTYPISTITFSKNPETESHRAEKEKAIENAWQYLKSESQQGVFPSYIASNRSELSTNQAPKEIFSSIVIADILPKRSSHDELRNTILQHIETQSKQGQLSFFEDRSLITPDSDTNSWGYSVLLENERTTSEQANKILNTILEYIDKEGKIQVWLSQERKNRLDHVVATNVAYLAYLLGREDDIQSTEEWITTMLKSGKYLEGSRFYHSPECFLYALSRLMKFPKIKKKLKTNLEEQLKNRIGKTNNPLDLAMRNVIADTLGIQNQKEKNVLLSIQEKAGSWPMDALYREGTKPRYFTNKSLPTAFALQALATK